MPRKRTRIEIPNAKIHLGQARRLAPILDAAESGGLSLKRTRASTDFVADVDSLLQSDDPSMLPRQRLKYQFSAIDEEVFLSDRGLATSYGIFGAPGSGKTFLFKYLLRQIFALNRDDPARKIGALILDPKAALMDDIERMVNLPDVARGEDIMFINTEVLEREARSVNVIDCALDSWALADLLVLAARSAGISASEDYWFLEWANLFGASLYLLNNFYLKGVSDSQHVVTLRNLMDALLLVEPGTESSGDSPGRNRGMRGIQRLAAQAETELENKDPRTRDDARIAISQIKRFFQADYVHTIMAFVARAYGSFQRYDYRWFSPQGSLKHVGKSFYDQIIEDGKIVVVSMSPTDPLVAKTLCTLIKSLFQQTVIQRLDRSSSSRVVMLGCDEYAEIASEVPGQPMGDGRFFSLSREFGCMGLLATQSVNVLQATSLKENWRSVFSTFGAKIFMRLADNETAKEATELAGKSTWYVTSRGLSHGKEGLSGSEQRSIQQYETVSTEVTTQTFEKGDAVALGSLDGNASSKLLHFFHVPDDKEQEARMAGTFVPAAQTPPPVQAVRAAPASPPKTLASAKRDEPARPAAPAVRRATFEDD